MDTRADSEKPDRKLGDEWLDWNNAHAPMSTDADYRIFVGFAVFSTILIILGAAFFWWLITPRLISIGPGLANIISILFLGFCGVLLVWLLLFVFSAVTRRPLSNRLIIPQLVNKLLSIVLMLGPVFGISRDKLTNSFLKIHNLFLGSRPAKVKASELLILLPRCLTKEINRGFREIRDRYEIHMFTVGGGSDARAKIREIRPRKIIAVACERDLLSGFKEINTQIPVIGFPNHRPEGPCKNTCVDLEEIERTIQNCLE